MMDPLRQEAMKAINRTTERQRRPGKFPHVCIANTLKVFELALVDVMVSGTDYQCAGTGTLSSRPGAATAKGESGL